MISTPCLATRGFLYAANAPEPACRQAGGRNANGHQEEPGLTAAVRRPAKRNY